MNEFKDPVCGTMVDPETAAASVTYESQKVYFCSDQCRLAFEADPERFEVERHEPPYTVSKGFVAPKFGSAGSGGLEYEPSPERHDRE
jgi:YHS domain-containing protein